MKRIPSPRCTPNFLLSHHASAIYLLAREYMKKRAETFLQQYGTMDFLTCRVDPKYIVEIVSVEPSPVRVALAHFCLADASSYTFDFDRSTLSVSILTTVFSISR